MPVIKIRLFEEIKWMGFFRFEKNGPSFQRINTVFNGHPNARNFHNPNETRVVEPRERVFMRVKL